MKNILILIGLFLGIAVFAFSCADSKKVNVTKNNKDNNLSSIVNLE